MFCANCGQQIPDDSAFCANCGAQVAAPAQAAPVAPAEPAYVQEQPAYAPAEPAYAQEQQYYYAEQPAYAQYDQGFAQPDFKAPKKKSKVLLPILIVLAVFILGGGAVAALNFGAISGFFVKTFAPADKYFKYVENQSFKNMAGDVSDTYGILLNNITAQKSGEGSIKFKVGDEAISLMEDLLEEEADQKVELDWLNEIELNMEANVEDDKEQVKMTLDVDGEELADFDVIMDMENNEMFFALLNLSDEYIGTSLEELGGSAASLSSLRIDEDVVKALPTDKELEKLLVKYLKIAIDTMEDVEKSSKKIRINGIEQKVTALEFELDTRTVCEMMENVLEAALDDADLEDYICNAADALADEGLIPEEEADELYDNLAKQLEELLEDVEEADFENETILVLTDYVNSKHEIIGRSLEIGGEEVFYYATVTKGKKIATEIECASLYIEGSGTKKGDLRNITYDIEMNDMVMATVEVKDFDVKKIEEGYINGTFIIEPASELLDELDIDSDITKALSIAKPQLELVFKSDEKTVDFEINVNNNDDLFFGLALASKEKNASKIRAPKDYYDIKDADEWLETLDLDEIIKRLRKTSIPEELVDSIEDAINGVADSSNEEYYEEEYDYEEEYEYEEDYTYEEDEYDYEYDYEY